MSYYNSIIDAAHDAGCFHKVPFLSMFRFCFQISVKYGYSVETGRELFIQPRPEPYLRTYCVFLPAPILFRTPSSVSFFSALSIELVPKPGQASAASCFVKAPSLSIA